MNSIASGQFPMQVWRDGVRHLWTPIHRKPLRNRPEERVRQQVIEYLLGNGWPKSRISTEETISPATAAREPGGLRTDLICYSRSFEPVILVECKAESIRIDEQTSQQAARYNRQVGAPWLLMTNGETDHWFHVDSKARLPRAMDGPPEGYGLRAGESLSPETDMDQPKAESGSRTLKAAEPGSSYYDEADSSHAAEYWIRRGFLGNKSPDNLLSQLIPLLERDWRGTPNQVRYLDFRNPPIGGDIDHFYAIREAKEHLIAFSIQSTESGGTRMVVVMNRERQNVGLMAVAVEERQVRIHSPDGELEADLPEELERFLETGAPLSKWTLPVETLFQKRS